MFKQRLIAFCVLGLIGLCVMKPGEVSAGMALEDSPSFEKEILPILKERCFQCHDGRKSKSGLRLDVRNKARAGGETGKLGIVAGKPDESELYHRLTTDDTERRMPPTKEKLSAQQIELVRKWIEAGADWPESLGGEKTRKHWAFVAPVCPPLAEVKNAAWVRNPVDRFILARLEKGRLAPSLEADKLTLLRRLHLDLIGLPPTIGEIDAFLADTSPTAYGKVVEKLLASPHYGERWGRHWLDAARYADSDGYEKDKSRQVYFYRDWVVNSFNRDLPYDQFLREQLAGDLMPQATQDQIVATGFLRNSMLNEEGGADPEQFRMDAMFDRMDAIGKGMLGITIQCAQCHTHKFDPITHEEYYRLFAYLNNDYEAQRVVYSPGELMKLAELQQKMKEIEEGLQHRAADWQQRMTKWEEEVKKKQVKWTVLRQLENAGDNGQRYLPQKDGSILCQGYAPTKFDTHFRGPSELTTIKAFRLELLNDPNLPCNGPGRSFIGTFALSEFKAQVTDINDKAKKENVKFIKALADYSNPTRDLEATYDDKSGKKRITGSIDFAIDGKNETAWGIDQGPGRRNQPRVAVFVSEKPISLPAGSTLDIFLTQQHGGWNSDDHMNNNLGRFRLSATDEDGAEAGVLPQRVLEVLQVPEKDRTPAQQATLFSYWRTTVPEWKTANDQMEELWNQWPVGASSLVAQSRETPRDTRLLKRGDFLKPDKSVTPGVPAFLHPLPKSDAKPSRLTLAEWIADRQSPTTARVFVNRVWQSYFGNGLVTTPEDVGVQSELPSHPELLDWLAVEFMEQGWSIKKLHRLIVLSATYRQSSKATPELLAKDPYNRLLARSPRLRVDGEVVRDIALSVSGLLDPKVGGPAIYSPAPSFLFVPPTSYGPFTWIEAQGSDRYRRALYTFRRRSTPYPMLTNFDAPNGDAACVKRVRSNTPLQALTTLNETVFVETARALGLRMLKDGGDTDASRLSYGFRLCTSRLPTEMEKAELEKLLKKHRDRFSEGWLSPAEVIFGSKDLKEKPPAGVTPTQWASYTLVARVLLNLDETITRE
ncbi:MAG TPA: PSD1 and planctomycete cytochrome C domain-containing protein [Gemmatales bacterium]|nr:PSD1 and planctomycete cytochrome C domain-containing protein [Gemmatales bacterium]